MHSSVINPKTGRVIAIDGKIHKKLITEGFQYDSTLNILNPPNSNTQVTVSTPIPVPVPVPITTSTQQVQSLSQIPLSSDDLTIKSLGIDNLIFKQFVHISDTHIPIHLHLSRKEEYLSVFDKLYKYLKTLHNIAIVITGDLLHVKLNLEAETVIMARDFLKQLSEIAPTVVIIGNHDFTENNTERADTMSAISHGLNVYSLKYSGIYRLGNILLSFSSLFDKKFIYHHQIQNPLGLPIYKLYHGTVVGSINYNGTQNISKHHIYPSLADFNGYDAVLMGHIHKHQKLSPSVAYVGSLIQQNYGESIDDHGILLWDLSTHTSQFIPIDNEYVFIDAIINSGKVMNEDELAKYANKKLRIRCKNTETNIHQYNQIQMELKDKYTVIDIQTGKPIDTYSIRLQQEQREQPQEQSSNNEDIITDLIAKFTQPELTDDINKFHLTLKTQTQKTPTSSWNIISLRFKNVFIYGNDHINEINFINGVHNICAPNTSGKSSIVNIITYALFDKTSNNASNKVDIIHLGKHAGFIELIFIHNGTTYKIIKTGTYKTRKGDSTYTYDVQFIRVSDGAILNGKDSRETVKNIATYVGDYDLFSIHHLISTKIGGSIIQMAPAEKLKHFHRLCETNQYDDLLKTCSEMRKQTCLEANLIQGQLIALNNSIKQHNYALESELLNQYEAELSELKPRIADVNDNIRLLSANKGQLTAELAQLKSQIKSKPELPEKSYEDLLAEVDDDNDDIPTDEASLKCFRQQYQKEIKPHTGLSVEEIKLQLTQMEFLRPNQTQLELEHKIQRIDDLIDNYKAKVKEFENDCNATDVDLTTEDDLQRIKLRLEKQLIELNFQVKGYEFNSEFISPQSSRDELPALIAVKKHMITQYQSFDPIPTDETDVEILKSLIQNQPIGMAYEIIDLNELNHLTNELNSLDSTCEFKTYDEISSLLESLNINGDPMVLVPLSTIEVLKTFIHSVQSGSFDKRLQLEQKINGIHLQIKHNEKAQLIRTSNQNIKGQIHYRLQIQLQQLQQEFQYYINNDILQITELKTQIETIKSQLNQIERYKRRLQWKEEKQLLDSLTVEYLQLTDKIKWYQQFDKLSAEIEIINNNLKYSKLIKIIDIRLDLINWELIKTYESNLIRITDLEDKLKHVVADIQEYDILSKTLNDRAVYLTQDISRKKILIERIQSDTDMALKLTETANKLNGIIKLYTEYERIFNRGMIPFEIMKLKLTTLNELINLIFEKYTKYTFKYDQSESGKLLFLVINRLSGCVLEPERLSGFESVILQLAINYAVLNICDTFKCGFIAIDESLDCIDQTRFIDEMPSIIDAIRHYYSSVLLISHRDVPCQMIDKNLNIHTFGSYSMINC
jgi:DNA repair exonuclease SbcCD ATPase subunit/DNA repair exonuclease SbcCD nuclease subunit